MEKYKSVDGRHIMKVELDSPAVSALRRAIAEFKQHWSLIGLPKIYSPLCFGRHVKPLVPCEFAVVSTHQTTLGLRGGLWPVLIMCNRKERPVPQQ
jgi:hypothetical protein